MSDGPWEDPNEAPGRMLRAIGSIRRRHQLAQKEWGKLMVVERMKLVSDGGDYEAASIRLRRIDNGYLVTTGAGERFAATSAELIEQISVALAEWCRINEETL